MESLLFAIKLTFVEVFSCTTGNILDDLRWIIAAHSEETRRAISHTSAKKIPLWTLKQARCTSSRTWHFI